MKDTFPYVERFQIIEVGDRSVGDWNYIPLEIEFRFKEPLEFDDDTESSRLEYLENIETMLQKWYSEYIDDEVAVLSETAEKLRSKEDPNY